MKFNIKNMPSEPDVINLGELEALRSYNYRSQKWFEGFEKELRELLEDCENMKFTGQEVFVESQFIKEILGE